MLADLRKPVEFTGFKSAPRRGVQNRETADDPLSKGGSAIRDADFSAT